MDNIKQYMKSVGQQARAASRIMAQADTATKNRALTEIAAALQNQSAQLLAENAKDVAAAKASGLDAASVDRLTLTEKTVRCARRRVPAFSPRCEEKLYASEITWRPSGIQVGR